MITDKKNKKKQKLNKPVFDVKEFGKRVAIVRDKVLGFNQTQFAPLLNTKQGLLSRLEAGIGGNIHTAFEIVNYLNQNGFQGHMLFREPFDISLFTTEINELSNKKKIMAEMETLEKTAYANYEKIVAVKKLIV